MDMSREDMIEEILKKIPKLSSHELPSLYEELDKMTRRIGEIITTSTLFEKESKLVRFDKASKEDIVKLIIKGRDVMIPFFVMICGFSERELERYGLRDIYSLRRKQDIKKQNMVADIITKFLTRPLSIETLLYKFYKNWEEHQKRHYRGREAENLIIQVLRENGYNVGKLRVKCKGKLREIDCAIPPDPENLKVIIMIRRGSLGILLRELKSIVRNLMN